MKVTVGKDTYLVHWETIPINQESPKLIPRVQKFRELKRTTCVLRKLEADGSAVVLSKNVVTQHYNDPANEVLARKLTFTKTVNAFSQKETRTAFWAEYLKTTRVTARTERQKNRKLKECISELTTKIAELEKAAEKVEAIA